EPALVEQAGAEGGAQADARGSQPRGQEGGAYAQARAAASLTKSAFGEGLDLAPEAGHVDALAQRDAQAERRGDGERLVAAGRDPGEAAVARQERGGVREEVAVELDGLVAVEDAAAHRRVGDDRGRRDRRAPAARVGAGERGLDGGGGEVVARALERGVVGVAAEEGARRAEAGALDQLGGRADEGIPDDVVGARAGDACEGGGERRVR